MPIRRCSLSLALAASLAPLAAQVPTATVEAAPRPQIAYQGRLLEAGIPVTGTRTFTFSLLDGAGAERWSSGPVTVNVSTGLYGVLLGNPEMTALDPALLGIGGLKLHVTVGGQALTPDVELVPALQARAAWEVTGAFSGDVGGTQHAITLLRLQGFPLDLSTAPKTGDVLTFDGTRWLAQTLAALQGPKGEKGDTGAAGPQGIQGPKGDTGATGAQGLQGLPGANGTSGTNGADGRTILNGPGSPVATGAAGIIGDFYLDTATQTLYGPKVGATWTGLTGIALKGAQGIQGLKGDTGATGAQGVQGLKGDTGATGAQGIQGLKGDTGATGAQGIQGLKGDTGATGAQGIQGLKGDTGATGAQG